MNPIVTVAFVVGIVVGWLPTVGWYEWWEMREENAVLRENIELERKNAQITDSLHQSITGIIDHYARNPVRVRVKGCEASPGSAAPRAEDVVLTVGGYKGDNRGAVSE